MVRRRLTLQRIREALAKHDRALQRAFEQAIRERKESINLTELARAIESRDIGRAVEIAGITRGDMFPLDQAMREAYVEGGRTITAAAPAFAARVALDGSAPRAVEWARDHVGGLITEIIDDQRNAIRQIITQQVADGIGPRQAAIAVRGEIGLTSQQAGYVANASRQLEALDGQYFTRELRDRRFDGIVRRAIAEGKPLSRVDIDRITQRYSDRLLKHRAEVISRTESITALRAGRHEGIMQAVEQGAINPAATQIEWSSTMDSRTRQDHIAMDGKRIPLGGEFVLPDGSRMRWPGDSGLGASASQLVQCRCTATYITDWLRG